jgi:sugar phosphate isomerase/epimerase
MLQFLGLNLGVMQGRLLPKYRNRFQAHPVGYWQKEFRVAKELGFTHIEFILDYNDHDKNPLLSKEGRAEINQHILETGVKVRSICADYFMEAPLHVTDTDSALSSLAMMQQLLEWAPEIGVECIVLPCVDHSSVKTEAEKNRLREALYKLVPGCEQNGVTIALEMDLNAEDFKSLIAELPACITVNYDTGNSAALGYDIAEEFEAYGNRISDIHIKDRVLGGGSVPLGSGNTDFSRVMQEIRKIQFDGILVMQAYRDDEGIEILKSQLSTLNNLEDQHA